MILNSHKHFQETRTQKKIWANWDVYQIILKKVLKYCFTQSCPITFTVLFLAPITVKITLVTSSALY